MRKKKEEEQLYQTDSNNINLFKKNEDNLDHLRERVVDFG